MEPKREARESPISIEDFDAFIKEKEIIPEENKEKLFESFILFQKFMSCMLGKQVNDKKEPYGYSKECKGKVNEEKNIEEIGDDKEGRYKNDNDVALNARNIDISVKYNESVALKGVINHDDIPIRPMTINFVELVEKNLAELHYQPEIRSDTHEKKIRRHCIANRTTQIKKDSLLSQSQNSTSRKKSQSPTKTERTQSLPKKTKQRTVHRNKKVTSNQINEEMKDEDEEKPKDLPCFIKEKEKENDSLQLKEKAERALMPSEEKKEDLFSQSDSLKIILPAYEELAKQYPQEGQLSDSDSNEIINNCDSFEDERNREEKERREVFKKDKNREMIEELEKIKGNVNTIISNPIYNQPKATHNRLKAKKMSKDPPTSIEAKQAIEYEEEISKLKASNQKNKQLREKYLEMKESLQREIEAFNSKKKKEFLEIEKLRNEELSRVSKLKPSKSFNNQTLLKQVSDYQLINKKDKEEIDQLKTQMAKLQEDIKIKENAYKKAIDKLKRQLQEAHADIASLKKSAKASLTNQLHYASNNTTYRNAISYTNPNTNKKEKKHSQAKASSVSTKPMPNQQPVNSKRSKNPFNIKVIKEDSLGDTFDMSFPSKYNLGVNDVPVKREQLGEGKEMITYSNQMKEIIFPSGVKKKVFADGYQIIFFQNDDIKQIYPKGKVVYYFAESKITQTTFVNGLNVYLFPNGQIEKHFANGNKEVLNKPASSNQVPNSNKKNKGEEVTLIKMKTVKNKDGRELHEFF